MEKDLRHKKRIATSLFGKISVVALKRPWLHWS